MKKTILVLLIVGLATTGCFNKKDKGNENTNTGNEEVSINLEGDGAMKKFSNQEELESFLADNVVSSGSYSYYGRMGVMEDAIPSTGLDVGLGVGTMTQLGETNLKSGSDDYSETNVQVKGVDEADIIKTDGKYVYAVVKNSLYIINAYPAADAEVLSKIEFKDRPQDIYIKDNRVIIYGANESEVQPYYTELRRHYPFTFLKIFDVSDPKNPRQVRSLDFEGNYYNSRLIGDHLYFVTNVYNYYYFTDTPVMPRIYANGEDLATSCESGVRCYVPDVYYFDIPYESYNFTSVNAINVTDDNSEINGDVYLMSYGQNMYVSPENMYITYTKRISEYQLAMEVMRKIIFPRLSATDQQRIAEIEAVENYILSPDEKFQKISQIIERYISKLSDEEQDKLEQETEEAMRQTYQDLAAELEKTLIHKIALNGGSLEYKTTGEVTGSVLNQFSMDEDNGYFRIATTKNTEWSRFEEDRIESYSNLYILDENLKVVGKVERLAEGERIYSVRFMQNRAYMVTFEQIDPLFTIDVSDPRNPRVLGELKIPGFSNYLHPYDDNLLIGIGKDTELNEYDRVTTKGIKLSLFDVSDISNPREVDVYVMGDSGSDSIALNDHKAFLFSKEKNLLAIPVSIREQTGTSSYGSLTFVGAAVFHIDENGFELKGQVDHSNGGAPAQRDFWRGYDYYDNTVKRALYIEDNLYTFSNNYLKINSLSDLSEVKNLPFVINANGDDFEVIN